MVDVILKLLPFKAPVAGDLAAALLGAVNGCGAAGAEESGTSRALQGRVFGLPFPGGSSLLCPLDPPLRLPGVLLR